MILGRYLKELLGGGGVSEGGMGVKDLDVEG